LDTANASWIRPASRVSHHCQIHDLRDPRADEIAVTLAMARTPRAIDDTLCGRPMFMQEDLATKPAWRALLADALETMLKNGMNAAILAEAAE
jgi:mannitol-1-phosphate/altronate dehydrogenase